MGITFQATYQVITQRTNLEAASRHNYGKNSLHEQNYECFSKKRWWSLMINAVAVLRLTATHDQSDEIASTDDIKMD